MQIVINQQAIEQLKKNHTLLELETFDIDGAPVTAYCVVPAEKIFGEIMMLDTYKELHAEFINSLKSNNNKLCKDIAEQLIGKFGGELDTFYEEILYRFKTK
jgi:hypothetical protein